MNKIELRTYINRIKKETSKGARLDLSGPILRRLAAHPRFTEAKTVLLYNSLPDEVETRDFVIFWSTRKCVLLPVVKGDELELRRYYPEKGFTVGAFGVLEPNGEAFTDYASIDLAVIPGVAFDNEGNRLGRGKGYYDKLLHKTKNTSLYKLGICFDFQKVDFVPTDAHDIRMDEVL
ncbi:MAG: 5-formyltetrahydrofolate cyclo-ligase [Paraprevotella sp.]|nr:5-formyltetrahydrofolate cyclo-ligase [Paraprevotella sp.]